MNRVEQSRRQRHSRAPYTLILFALLLAPGLSREARAQWTQPDAQGNINNTNSGNVGVGTTAPQSSLHVSTSSTAAGARGIIGEQTSNDGNGSLLVFRKSRAGASVQNGDSIGNLLPQAFDGANWVNSSRVRFAVDGPVSAGSVPTSMQFLTGDTTSVERMRVTSAGNVGIGTTTPAHRLDVTGTINASGGLCIAGNCKTAWSEVSSQWTTSGANIFYAGGNVGIGTTAPANPLHVRATNVATMQFQAGSIHTGFLSAWEAGSVLLSNNRDPRTGVNYNQTVPGGQLTLGNTGNGQLGDLVYHATSAGAMAVTTERVRFTADGNVGIGTSTPTERLHVVGNINVTGNINAKYQDVAEWVPSTQSLAAGTVVVLDTARSNHVVASSTSYDTRVAGVVSAQPGVLLGERGDGKLMVATTGRVKVRVDATRGPVRVGDLLVTSDVEGVAMKSEPLALGGRQLHMPGTLIGKALEPLEKGVGEILVLLSLQ